jgi:hypothetical protein
MQSRRRCSLGVAEAFEHLLRQPARAGTFRNTGSVDDAFEAADAPIREQDTGDHRQGNFKGI